MQLSPILQGGSAHNRVRAAIVLCVILIVSGRAIASTDTPVVSESTVTISPTVINTNMTVPAIEPAKINPLTGIDLLNAPISPDLASVDAATAEKLRELLATALAQHVDYKDDRSAVETFYRDRGFAPLWIINATPTARAKEAIGFLQGADADALDPADYFTPSFAGVAPEAMAEDEIRLTNSVLTFARHARTGRVSFTRVSENISYDLQFPKPAGILATMVESSDIRQALDSYNPQQAGYKALKTSLTRERSQTRSEDTGVRISEKPTLRSGANLKLVTHLNSEARLRSSTIGTIIANMERWRWLPHDLGEAYVMVNIPDYTLKVVDHERTAWSTRIVVGKVGRMATPLLSETMKSITINPTWNVPPSIVRNEYLPALEQDPDALSRIGLKIQQNRDGSLRIYQPPGESNALGHIRFNFPNKFLVYQHDTPNKHLFAKTERAYSHGCMRVQDPQKYAEVLLSISQPMEGFTADQIRRFFGVVERTINLKNPIPVHLTYQTAFVDDAGSLQIRQDLYGIDKDVIKLLGSRRHIADVPIAQKYN